MVNVDSKAQLHNTPRWIWLNHLSSQKSSQDISLMAAFLIIIIIKRKYICYSRTQIPDGNYYYCSFNSSAATILHIHV